MKYFSLTCLLYCSVLGSMAQHTTVADSLTDEICHTLTITQNSNDSALLTESIMLHLSPYLSSMTEKVSEDAYLRIVLRLWYRCNKYNMMMRRMAPPSKHWKYVYRLPNSKVSVKDANYLFEQERYYYIEDPDTTRLTINKNFWIDLMPDSTYSKLSLKRTSATDFEISFIESNNKFKSRLSLPGDIYRYRIVNKTATYYELAVQVPGITTISIFKVYMR